MKKIFYVLATVALVSCGSEEIESPEIHIEKKETPPDSPELRDKVEAIEKIFYSIPTPRETMDIIEAAGAVYDIQLTNDPDNVANYTEKTERALNMGVYGADVNYCSAFDKSNDVIFSLAAAQALGKELGLEAIFSQDIHDRVLENTENQDSVQEIITTTFWEVESKLQDDGRPELAALIIIGGWVEGMNIACGQAKINLDNQEMIRCIAEQDIALKNVIGLANKYEASNERIRNILAQLEDLKASFDKIEVTKSDGSGGENNGVPTIGKKIERNLSSELLEEITVKVFKMRNDIVG